MDTPPSSAQFTPTGRVTCDGQELDAGSQRMLVQAAAVSPGPFRQISLQTNRLALRNTMMSRPPNPIADIEDIVVPGVTGEIRVRVYRPHGTAARTADASVPATLFFHGGGWVRGDLDTHSFMCGTIAAGAECVVFAVDYRRAPEHEYPAAIEDACAAFDYIQRHAVNFAADSQRIAVTGDSAGATLATGVCLHGKAQGVPQPCFQLLLYPISDITRETRSYELFANGFGLTRDGMRWFIEQYAPDVLRRGEELASPLLAPDVSGLAAAHVIVAGFDVLRDEGIAYGERLRAAGVPTEVVVFPGTYHGFFAVPELDVSDRAIDSACNALKTAFKLPTLATGMRTP